MKTKSKTIIGVIALAVGFLCFGARTGSTATPEQGCGEVSDAQVIVYLQGHGHTVLRVKSILGTCNREAEIENCGTAIVFIVDGNITWHLDHPGICDD